jgi:HEAT repeat protein
MNSKSPLGALSLALVAACASVDSPKGRQPQAVHPQPEDLSIGFFLSQLSTRIERWNFLKLEGKTASDDRQLHLLEQHIRSDARLRLGEVIAELESGPPTNRSVAAMALGFTGLDEAQSPLLAALDDREPRVVANALLALGLLALPDTPLSQVCYLLRRDADPFIRNNAALAIKNILAAGGTDECAIESARVAVLDAVPGVRTTAALILALTNDTESMNLLGDLLHDEVPLVCSAAARSLAHLGRTPSHAGSAARVLVAALDRVDARHREIVRHELVRLSKQDLGDKVEPWRDWAFRLP